MNKLKEKEKSQKGERNLISYCKIRSCVTSLFTPLKFLVLVACVAWRFCRAGRRSAGAVQPRNSPAKRARTSGEAVSLPSPAFITQRAQPKPPCYAGYGFSRFGAQLTCIRSLPIFYFCSFSFLSRICPDRDSLVKDAVDLASQISKKSPIAMSGTKHNLNYSRDHSTKEGLEYMVSFLRKLYKCSFISFEKRSACANASEHELLLRGMDFALSLLRRVELLAVREFRVKMNNSQVEYTSIYSGLLTRVRQKLGYREERTSLYLRTCVSCIFIRLYFLKLYLTILGIKLTCKTRTIYVNFSQVCFSASFHKNWLIRSTRTDNYLP